ncbi:hypothetical protein CRG98_009071 [Punica granatum]|uniref:Uncharacterized protein n=1 Tax=Punica granatum TaxID=22663 RepID=A0A2I0KRU5_PUNGR|nr:hypothetical protein CRG98_009071 [Punica granatum]
MERYFAKSSSMENGGTHQQLLTFASLSLATLKISGKRILGGTSPHQGSCQNPSGCTITNFKAKSRTKVNPAPGDVLPHQPTPRGYLLPPEIQPYFATINLLHKWSGSVLNLQSHLPIRGLIKQP